MGRASGVEFQRGEEVVISHQGRKAVTLRGAAATRFLEDVEKHDPQDVMARATGNYGVGTSASPGSIRGTVDRRTRR
jgi:hypothetical protein